MLILGAEVLETLFAGAVIDVKMVFNERGAILFPASRQHREMTAEGISYEDNYAGNAMAAMVRKEAIEIRFHKSFADAAVAKIVRSLLAKPEMAGLAGARVMYQGRVLLSGPS
jgi:hypothetical protein